MMTVAVVALSLVILTAAGMAIVSVLFPAFSLYLSEWFAIGYLVGIAAISYVWLLFSPFYGVIQPVWLLSGFSILFIVAARSSIRSVRLLARERIQWLEALLMVVLMVEVLSLCAAAWRTPLGWDGTFNFEMKARFLFEQQPQGVLPLGYLADASRQWSHPQYPLMIPFAEFWLYSWLGRVDQTAIKVLFPLFYLSLMALVCGSLRRTAGLRAGLFAAVATGLLPPLTLLHGATSGYADVPLAAAVVGAVGFATHAMRTNNAAAFRLGGILAGVAAWIKSEGLLLAATLGVLTLALVVWRGTSRVRDAASMLWIPLLCASPWIVVQHRYGLPNADFVTITAANVLAGISRTPVILASFARELLLPGHWALVWPCWAGAALLVITSRRVEVSQHLPYALVAASLVFYAAVFSMSSWPDVAEHISLAFPRLLVPLAPIAVTCTVLAVSGIPQHGEP